MMLMMLMMLIFTTTTTTTTTYWYHEYNNNRNTTSTNTNKINTTAATHNTISPSPRRRRDRRALLEVRAVEASIDDCWRLKQEVGSFAFLAEAGFAHLDFLQARAGPGALGRPLSLSGEMTRSLGE